jgi:radical SAM superfamily enzyme YgiQ (UPF0313 family)
MTSVLLIQPPDPEGLIVLRDHAGKFGIIEKKTSMVRYDIFPPLDLAYSAALLEKNDFDVSIIDSPTLNLEKSEILKEVMIKNPNLIFVNTSGGSISSDLDFASWLKNTSKVETVALTQVFSPEDILKKGNVDVFIRGEIEYTILELCQKYPDIKKIKGLFFKRGDKFFYNPKRSLIKNLNELPFPAYHLLPMNKYSHHMFKIKNFTTALTSRGCPFGCIYCLYPLGYGNIWRGRSPENVLGELKILTEEYKVKSILFRDQVFNFIPKRAEKICDGMIKEDIDIEWRCEARVELFSKKLLKKMKQAGCIGINVGIESGDPIILKNIAKGGVSEQHIRKVKKFFNDAREVGLESLAFFMIGFPGETKESISNTFKLAKEIKANHAWFSSVVPYPGTKLYELAEKRGWLLTRDMSNYTGRSVVMKTDSLTEEEIKNAVDTGNFMFSKDSVQLLKTIFSLRGISSAILDPKKAFNFTLGRFTNKNYERS